MKDIRVAAVCMNSSPGEIDRNLGTIRSFILKASDKGAETICFPELCFTGYILEKPERACPPSLFKEASERILEMAKMHGMVVMAGIIEVKDKGERPYISQIVAGPQGILGIYRKTHLSPPEKASYRQGEEIGVYRCTHLTFGVQLCYESHFPELSTLMALRGAEAIFMPHASPRGNPEEKTESWLRHLPGRAFDNGLYVIACNQVRETKEGLSFPGVVLALSPSGKTLAKYCGKEEKMVLVDMRARELSEIRNHRMRYFLPSRRPELYKEIATADQEKRPS